MRQHFAYRQVAYYKYAWVNYAFYNLVFYHFAWNVPVRQLAYFQHSDKGKTKLRQWICAAIKTLQNQHWNSLLSSHNAFSESFRWHWRPVTAWTDLTRCNWSRPNVAHSTELCSIIVNVVILCARSSAILLILTILRTLCVNSHHRYSHWRYCGNGSIQVHKSHSTFIETTLTTEAVRDTTRTFNIAKPTSWQNYASSAGTSNSQK